MGHILKSKEGVNVAQEINNIHNTLPEIWSKFDEKYIVSICKKHGIDVKFDTEIFVPSQAEMGFFLSPEDMPEIRRPLPGHSVSSSVDFLAFKEYNVSESGQFVLLKQINLLPAENKTADWAGLRQELEDVKTSFKKDFTLKQIPKIKKV